MGWMKWPEFTLPPINLWSVPLQWIKYKERPVEQKEVSEKVRPKSPEHLYGMRKNN